LAERGGEWQGAVSFWGNVVERRHETDPFDLLHLAIALARTERSAEARDYLNKALEVDEVAEHDRALIR